MIQLGLLDKTAVIITGSNSEPLSNFELIRKRFLELDATEFEYLVSYLLRTLGFEPTQEIGKVGDGGIDFEGILDVSGVASINLQVQVKRYDKGVIEEDVQKLFSNYDVIGQVSKSRSLFQLNNITIHLDKLENGEEFIEVEAKDFDERFDELVLKNQCLLLFEDLRISYQEHLPTGYLNTSIS